MAKNPMINPSGPKDPVTNPAHYTSTKISPIEVIVDWNLPFDIGNCLKYLGRYKMKNGLEDLKKALWYLNHAIHRTEEEMAARQIPPYDVFNDWFTANDSAMHEVLISLYHDLSNQHARYVNARNALIRHITQLETAV